MEQTRRDPNIDLVKVVAMIMVMTTHLHPVVFDLQSVVPTWFYRISAPAIPLFFMVSGYLMARRDVTYHYAFKKIRSILRFIVSMVLVVWLVRLGLGHAINRSLLLYNLLAWPLQKGDQGAFWYLCAMIIMYLLMPGMLKILRDKKKGLILLCVLLIFECMVFTGNMLADFELTVPQAFRFWNWLTYFVIGALIQIEAPQPMAGFRYYLRMPLVDIIVLGTAFAGVMILIQAHLGVPNNEYHYSSPLCVFYSTALFLWLERIRLGTKSVRVISWLSTLFLPVYVFHTLVLDQMWQVDWFDVFGPLRHIVAEITFCGGMILMAGILMKIPGAKRLFSI